ncbi:PPM1D phosphatase, partial [Acromyrmex insinuator]
MPLSIGVNLRVTGHCNQGGRKYMEDMFCVAFQPTPDDKDLEYAFFGIFDGHGGGEAATFAKEHLMDIIVKQKNFWSDRDEDVLRAIRDGYMNTHYAMWRELDKWPRTASGLPSTAGTTASIAFIRKGKIYIGHVGDSAIILGYQAEDDPQWRAKALTRDHKPESGPEMTRIQESGGKVVSKSGVPRVVWNRPRIGHKGPVRRSTHMDEIPFLAVARSLGDLWSYNSELNTFVVSPEPDVKVIPVDVKSHRCLIFGTDGLWNMLSPQAAVAIVQTTDRHNEKHLIASQQTGNGQADLQMWINPSKNLVDRALERWSSTRLRADNTSVVTLMLDPSGPCRSEVLFNQKKDRVIHHGTQVPVTTREPEIVERINSKVTSPCMCMPIPPPSASLDLDIDPKQPDSSNGNEETVDQTLQPEIVSCPEKSISSQIDASELRETAIDKSIETTDVGESIQVAEISSSQMPEEPGDLESKKTNEINHEKLKYLEDEEKPIIEQNEKAKNDHLQSQIQSNLKSNKFIEPKEIITETEMSNVTRQNACPNANEEALHPPLVSRLRRSGIVSVKSNSFDNGEVKSGVLNGSRHNNKQHPLFPARADVRTIKRRHSLSSSQTQNAFTDVVPTPDSKTYVSVKSRYSRVAKSSIAESTMVEETKNALKTASDCVISNKRRHSTITQASVSSSGVENSCPQQEPCAKMRTRSEDQRHSPTDENDPANQTMENANARLSWPTSDKRSDSSLNGATLTTLSSSSNTFQRRSLEKKATPVKAIRRSSINGSTRLQHLRGSFGLREWDQGRNNRTNNCNNRRTLNRTVTIIGPTDSTIPQRWLRSDTMAATPVKTLRSRNVDIAGHTISAQLVHQYGVVKQNRLPLPKLKQSANSGSLQSSRVRSSSLSANKLKQANGNSGSVSTCATINPSTAGSTSAIAKKVKSPYNPSARSLSTRSRIKRLGK